LQKLKLPKIIGHRGACGLAPENTISSLKKASSLNLSCVEVDVKISKDSVPILFHDESLERTTDGVGFCNQHNYLDLRKLDAGKWFDKKFANEKIPSLSECLDFLYEKKMNLNIEIKPNKKFELENVKNIVKLINKKPKLPNYYFTSFHIESLKLISEYLPNINRGLLIDNYISSMDDILIICEKYRCFSIGLDFNIINSEIIKFLKKNKLIITAYTINNIKIAKELFDLGVDSIFTDRPDTIKI